MGGTSSQPMASAAAGTYNTAEEEGVFSLSAQMQQQLAQDFHSEQIVQLFGQQIEKIGERKAAILQSSLQQRVQLEQSLKVFREQNQKVQQQLDTAIEKLEDQFTDSANVVEYDMDRLAKKYLGHGVAAATGSANDNEKIACLMERSDIATCYQHNQKDPLVCDAFVQALTKCAERTVTGSA